MSRIVAVFALALLILAAPSARAANCGAYPFTLINGTPNDANKVMADFNAILNCANNNLAHNGTNSDITSITGLVTPLSLAQGGTGTALARTPALSGANNDITSITGLSTPLATGQGGTGTSNGSNLVPVGTVMFTAGSSAPIGWALANGTAVSRTTQAALFAVIGTTYGAGDGSTTFNLPDCRARSIAGRDAGNATGRMTGSTAQGVDASALGNTGGEQAHTQTVGEMPSHNHGITDPGHHHTVTYFNATGGGTPTNNGGSGSSTLSTSTATTGITINNNGGGNAFNVLGPTIILNCIIKE